MREIGYHGKVVAFDLDDTLFRERDFCRSGFRYLCSPDSYPVLDIETYPSFKDLERLYNEMDEALSRRENPFDIFETLWQSIAERNGVEWDIKKHIDNYRAHSPSELPFLPEVEHTLLELRERGIRMALITDGRSKTQRNKIQALDL